MIALEVRITIGQFKIFFSRSHGGHGDHGEIFFESNLLYIDDFQHVSLRVSA